MSEELLIHPERISEKPLVFEGTVDIEEFPRLEESLATPETGLRYMVTARLDKQRRKVVSCIIEGFVFLTCQATLEAFRHEISIDERLVLVDDESGLPPIEEESDAEDYLVADGPVDVLDLVEDAILLALPMVPRKPGIGGPAVEAKNEGKRESPFAALASLKKRNE
ncbi:MAG TPA: YceD family protein [Usitatibacter sp.]|nr:YceD family protein [Usitatibacter sp.]